MNDVPTTTGADARLAQVLDGHLTALRRSTPSSAEKQLPPRDK